MPRRGRSPLLALAGLLLLAALAPGCRSVFPRPSSSREALRIGTLADAPPLAFRQQRRWAGVEADLGRAFAQRLGLRPVFVALSPDQLTSALLDGQVDMLMAGLPVTEERRVLMDFSSPYLVVGQSALLCPEDLPRFNTEIRIRSAYARAGVIKGSSGDRLVSRYFAQAERIEFDQIDSALDALRQHEIELLVHDAPALWWQARQHAETFSLAPVLFAREEIAWAFRRGSVRLREAANQALAEWQRDGTLETILRRWIPVSP